MRSSHVKSARLIIASVIAILMVANGALAQFELVNGGAVIANTSDSNNDDTAFPTVVKIPDWVAAGDRADPSANYYICLLYTSDAADE